MEICRLTLNDVAVENGGNRGIASKRMSSGLGQH